MFTTLKDAEAKLVETANSIREESNSWRALHFRFARLLEHYRSDYQLKIAVNLINDLLKNHQGGVFMCYDSDIFVVCRSVTKAQLEKVVFQLRYLFMDDPLAYNVDGHENDQFCRVFDLSVSWAEFLEVAKLKLAISAKSEVSDNIVSRDIKTNTEKKPSNAPVGTKIKPFTPQRLASVEKDIASADLSRVIRRQPICAATPGREIRKVFDELYINIGHLRQLIMADVDFTSNRWLFKYLTEVLDFKMLDLLKRNSGRYFDAPISLNLNTQTLLSDRFAEFDAAIKPATKVSIVIEIHVADVFADMEAFLLAKDTVQKLGYRVCLDGLTNMSFTQVDRERLGFDLAKIQWNADIEVDAKSSEYKKLAYAINTCGPNRVILCRCDSKASIEYGDSLGISLFQGRFLDKVINPEAKVQN